MRRWKMLMVLLVRLKNIRIKQLTSLFCSFALLFATIGCGSSTQKGKLTGVEYVGSISDFVKNELDNLEPTGVVIITKDNGKEVRAYYTKEWENKLRGGQILKIEKIKNTDKWKVIKILEEPK